MLYDSISHARKTTALAQLGKQLEATYYASVTCVSHLLSVSWKSACRTGNSVILESSRNIFRKSLFCVCDVEGGITFSRKV